MSETAAAPPTAWHRALADERRSRIVAELRGEPGGLDAQQLAERLGLHANTIRWHLGVLGDAGIVAGRRSGTNGPGRPRTLYSLSLAERAPAGDDFRLLASVLTSVIAREPDAAARSESAGREWGRYLAPRRSPLVTTLAEDAIADAVRLLEEQGFAPEPAGREIRLRRCPYLDLAEQHPEVVCSVHRGVLAGALDGHAPGIDVELEPFAAPSLCLVRLRRAS